MRLDRIFAFLHHILHHFSLIVRDSLALLNDDSPARAFAQAGPEAVA